MRSTLAALVTLGLAAGVAMPGCTVVNWELGGTTSAALSTGKRMFLTSEKRGGAFGGVLKADAICEGTAKGAGLDGHFIAYLGDGTQIAEDRFVYRGPWTMVGRAGTFLPSLDGSPSSKDSWNDEHGEHTFGKAVWMGATRDAVSAPACDDWTSEFGRGKASLMIDGSFDRSGISFECSFEAAFLCFEQ